MDINVNKKTLNLSFNQIITKISEFKKNSFHKVQNIFQ